MAPKGGNTKKEAGRAKKAENETKKQQLAEQEKERKEAAKWDQGAKWKAGKEDKEAKRKEALAAKAERERLLAEEEASLPSKPKASPKTGAGKKKASASTTPRAAGPGALAAGGGLGDVAEKGESREIESFAASNVDDAIAMLEVVNAKQDKASVGQAAAGLEKHPERRFKAAFEAYQERELPNLRKDHPGLRLNQYKELLFKQFQKSPENPFNQTVVSYDATKDERLEALEKRNKEVEERLKERTRNLTLDD
ncbi:hypothetical protein ACEPAI_206 [Sanghuangporus weigelae]